MKGPNTIVQGVRKAYTVLGIVRPAILLLLFGAGLSFGQGTNETKRLDYSDFRLITERNIFNPRRYPRSSPQPTRPASRVDAFTLVGTMSYEKGPFAFFEGTSSEYQKVLKPADSIAGYKVTNIGFNSVKLTSRTNEVQLPVGMQMRREEGGSWHLAAAPEPSLESSNTGIAGIGGGPSSEGSAALAGTNATATASGPAGASDVLRRLMQRREQEMNR